MSIPQVTATPRQENSQPVARTQATLPAAPIRDSLSSAPASRDCVEIYCDVIKTILAFIKEKICCCLFSSPQHTASTTETHPSTPVPAPETSSSLPPEQNITTETGETQRMVSQETLRRFEEIRARVAEFRNFIPQFPEDRNPDALQNTHSRGLPHYNRTNREAFDDMQDAYLRIIALIHPVLVTQLGAQEGSRFRLNAVQLRDTVYNHPNDREIRCFAHERSGAGDIQYDAVFQNFQEIYLAIASLRQE